MATIIGLTGGIGSGKTTVANHFHDNYDIDIVDADIIAREVVEPGSDGIKAIAHYFGNDVISNDGTLNRVKLRELVFADPKNKQWIDNLLHPMIRQRMQQQLQQVRSPYALLVIPLMVENGLQSMADRVLVVDVSPNTQIERTLHRDGGTKQQIRAILNAQASREQRLNIAHDIINNDDCSQSLDEKIAHLHLKYLALCN
ncbi:dephospho-CoA kinase [Vibrio sp. UCD-FRSSP16_10]|uniref:dephospho-CoA kinase n=1 Tax=unclassified Vibrio TaxID=2614977 RepID=UPI0007FF1CB5|nr:MULTISPECIES: dephospho-CoA kinase [unclassified Vibrio]OBT17304.1 dephospho-CoA kinase [Vibrio sp. UCD-FRSSP16_30]OBT23073.1 dephospho-CoA kinase [Vibrio sp. UCD-FRSSP16_10]